MRRSSIGRKRLRAFSYRLLALGFAVAGLAVAATWSPPRSSTWEHTTSPYYLSKVSTSMNGPNEVLTGISLGSGGENELLWLTGYEAVVVDEAGNPESQEFMCHGSLFIDSSVRNYRQALGTRKYGSRHLFTLAQGAQRIEFPPGFALPFPASQRIQLKSMALNLNPEHIGKQVRHRIRAEFLEDSKIWKRPTPLFMVEAAAGVQVPAPGKPGKTLFRGHWMVPPGEQTNVSDITDMLALPFDTRAYYVTAHLHPLARWQELRDKTTGEAILRIHARTSADGFRLEEVIPYCSTEGLPLYKDHRYELVTRYNNTRNEPYSVMSNIYLYCEDKEFQGVIHPVEGSAPSTPGPDEDAFCTSDEGQQ